MRKIPEGAKQIPARPLALGEATGHHHSVICDEAEQVEMYEKDGQTFVRIVGDGATVQHQEHKPHALPKDTEWGIRIATEVTDWGRQRVID
jgi:hypothetical protein